jgi:hypothetical protein
MPLANEKSCLYKKFRDATLHFQKKHDATLLDNERIWPKHQEDLSFF